MRNLEGLKAWVSLGVLTVWPAVWALPPASAAVLQPGDLVVVDSHNVSGKGAVVDINPTTGTQTVISSAGLLTQPSGVAIDASGNVIVSNFGGIDGTQGAILKIDPVTGQQSVLASGGILALPTSVMLDATGQLIVTQEGVNQTSGALLRIDPISGVQTLIASGGFIRVAESAALDGGSYLVSSYQQISGIVRINAQTGIQTILSSGGLLNLGPHGICVDDTVDHNLLVAVTAGLVDVDTITGAQLQISSGGNLNHASDVTQDSLGRIYMTDEGPLNARRGLVLGIDRVTGAQTILASGGNLLTPQAIAVYVPEPGSVSIILASMSTIVLRRRRTPLKRDSLG